MIRVGVIRGGIWNFEESLNNGEAILSCLREDNLNSIYKPVDILIDRDGLWHIGGVPASMDKIAHSVDVIFNALYGGGHDGKIHQALDQHSIPYVGSSSFISALVHNRELAKIEFAKLGIKTPKHILYEAYLEDLDGEAKTYPERKAREVFERLPPPWIVKPLTRGSSMGAHVCKTMPELIRAFEVGMHEKVSILVEEMIEGRQTSISVLENFRNQAVYPFICVDNFSTAEKREVERFATLIHRGLHLKHFSQSDFIITPKKGIYAIEVKTLPKVDNSSHLYKHLEAVGSSIRGFLHHIIGLSLHKK